MAIQIPVFIGFMLYVNIGIVSSDKIILTTTGPVRGMKVTGINSDAEAYLGIPFAEPPVGELRFRKPVPIQPWDDVYNATIKPYPCCQNATEKLYWMPDTENMTEDCLYLNIWVPSIPSERIGTKKMTVMVWIHGGAFNIGSSEMDVYDGAQLATYGEVIVASFNYRIGVLGFLTALVDDANGNMGMHDQILALKWLKKNVAAFGGNPEEIVLFGESAGAMSIGLHLISPLTRNLFKRAILESGASMHPMSFEATKTHIDTSNRIAKIIGCADRNMNITSHPQRVVDCLKSVPFTELTRAEGLLMKSNPITFYPRWGDEYLPAETTQAIREFNYKNTELLVGVNEDEGSFFLTIVLPDYFGVYGKNGMEKFSKRMAKTMIKAVFQFTEQKNVSEIAEFYVSHVMNQTNGTLRKAIFKALGDYLITCNSVFFSDFYSRNKNQLYFYVFTHRPSTTLMSDWLGITHFEEVPYVFGHPINHGNFTNAEQILSRRIMDRWITFAKTGNPNIPDGVKWQPYTHRYPMYLSIDTKEELKKHPTQKRCEFWRNRFYAHIDTTEEISERFMNWSNAHSTFHKKLTILPVAVGIIIYLISIIL